jgi:integrase
VFTYRKNEEKIKDHQRYRKRSAPIPAGRNIGSVKTAFNAAVRRAGIEDFRFHDLRHTFASHMIMKGGTLKEVQEILGHKTMTMTLRYAHLSQEHKKKAVNLLNGLTASAVPAKRTCHKSVTSSKSQILAVG